MVEYSWSIPQTDVISRAKSVVNSGQDAVLATVIDVEGSSYRRPGAKMLLTGDGEGFGHITAGCLEDEVVKLSEEVLADNAPRVETYDLTEGGDVWGLGIGCNGVIDVLLEPLGEDYCPAFEAVTNRESIVVLTVFEGDRVVCRSCYRADEGFVGELPTAVIDREDKILDLLEADKSGTIEARDLDVFVDPFVPPPRLVVLGTGNDVPPVVELASKNGYEVTVAGFRGGRTNPDRFSAADEVVSTSPARLTEAVDIDEDTYVVAMTHNFVDDRLALEQILKTRAPYIGLLGPRKRFEEMLEVFEEEGTEIPDAELDRLYTPAGLDIGGDSPYQIAHSIIAEVLAVTNERSPRHLREREGPIHHRIKQ